MILSLAINENCQACFCWLTARRTWVRMHLSICRLLHSQSSRATNSALICSGMFIFARAKYCLYLSRPHITSIAAPPKSP
jgi:hypothetical protein